MADVAMPNICCLPADSFQPLLLRIALPKVVAEVSESTALQTVDLPAEISVYAKLSIKEVFKSDKGGKLIQYNVDILLLDAAKPDPSYQLFKHSVMKNMDSSKSPTSAAGAAVAEATRSCHFVTQGRVTKDGKKITLEGAKEMVLELAQDAHLKCSKEAEGKKWTEVFCRLGRQYSLEVQGCDKTAWSCKEGSSPECTAVCALQECESLLA